MKKLEKKLLEKMKRDQNYKIRLENIIGRKDIGMKRFQANISSHQFSRFVTVSSINTVNSISETTRGDSHSNRGQHDAFSFFRSRNEVYREVKKNFRRTSTCNFNVSRDIFFTNFFRIDFFAPLPFANVAHVTHKLFAARLNPADRKMTKTFIP